MRIAFYAPLKPPHHPTPSGDRTMARLLIRALAMAGYDVELASVFRSLDAAGDPERQQRLGLVGDQLADRLVDRYRRRSFDQRPNLWFTYHIYYKAPDWIGMRVSRALRIPYVVAEASHAAKQQNGPWDLGFAAAAAAIANADLLINLNTADVEGIRPMIAEPSRLVPLKPFIDAGPFARAAAERKRHRANLAQLCGFDAHQPLLLALAMMRGGDKLESYHVLGKALTSVTERPWRLIVAGDGPAANEVKTALAPLGGRVTWLGRVEQSDLAAIYAACDLYVWPAVREAYGLAFLEAQAAGLPVVAGRTGGVADVVADAETGLLVPAGNVGAFAGAVDRLLADPERRRAMGARAAERVRRDHDLPAAAAALTRSLRDVTKPRGREHRAKAI